MKGALAYYPDPGDDIVVALTETLRLATLLQAPVTLRFGGAERIRVFPGDSVTQHIRERLIHQGRQDEIPRS